MLVNYVMDNGSNNHYIVYYFFIINKKFAKIIFKNCSSF